MNNVTLKGYTQGVDELEGKSLLDVVEYVARVSNPSNQKVEKVPGRLTKYLIKHFHWSPFEMVNALMEINTTRDIARQILRHRSFSFQEFSQRYEDPTDYLGFTIREARLQDTKNRQNSLQFDDDELKSQWTAKQEQIVHEAQLAYKWAVDEDRKIAKEQARSVLPEGNTNSRMYMNGTLRSWIHYIQLRTRPGTQKEHMDIAFECALALEPVFPMIKDFTVHYADEEEAYEKIINEAARRYREWSSGVKGQIITMKDGLDYWVMQVATEWAKEGKL